MSEDKVHSHIGASSAYRWSECPGSPNMIAKCPPQETNRYAAEGTAAHMIAERCALQGVDPDTFLGEVIEVEGFEFEVDEEMCNAIRVYLEVLAEPGYATMVECKIDLSRLHPGLFGTSDAIQRNFEKHKIRVVDFKYGKGSVVEVRMNKQGLYYVLGSIEAIFQNEKKRVEDGEVGHPIEDPLIFGWDQFDEIELVIVQPRARHKDGPVRRWVIPKGVLDKFQDDLVAAAKETTRPDAPLKAGSWCKFCPAIAVCPAQMQLISDQCQTDFKTINKSAPSLPKVENLTIDQLAGVMKYADQISGWLKSVEAHALTIMSHGTAIPGFKLVKKKANRRWVNEDEAKSALSLYMTDDEMLSPRELKSPAQIEKALKKPERELIKPLIETPDTGLTIAEESDPRQGISGGSVMDDFDTIGVGITELKD